MIDAVWDNVLFLKALPGDRRQAFANYPESVRCPKKNNSPTKIVAATLISSSPLSPLTPL